MNLAQYCTYSTSLIQLFTSFHQTFVTSEVMQEIDSIGFERTENSESFNNLLGIPNKISAAF